MKKKRKKKEKCKVDEEEDITGRKKEMIIRGGENIYPKEIEEVLYRHPAILDAAIVGFPDKVTGRRRLRGEGEMETVRVFMGCESEVRERRR